MFTGLDLFIVALVVALIPAAWRLAAMLDREDADKLADSLRAIRLRRTLCDCTNCQPERERIRRSN